MSLRQVFLLIYYDWFRFYQLEIDHQKGKYMNLLNKNIQSVSAFAPATCANVAVGFDIMGFSLGNVGDTLTLTKRNDDQLIIDVSGVVSHLPTDPSQNTATIGLLALLKELGVSQGFNVHLKKGIPLSSGMGGSAACAVAALIAFNDFLTAPLPLCEIAKYALLGEAFVSGHGHLDNIIPCLFGGLTLSYQQDSLLPLQLPTASLYCALIHPHLEVSTQAARALLSPNLSLKNHVTQSAYLGAFITGLHRQDYTLLAQSLHDVIIEPQRAHLVPGFYDVKNAALKAGALGASLSGSGPSIFALCQTRDIAEQARAAMDEQFQQRDINTDSWVSLLGSQGAHTIAPIGGTH